MKKKTWSFEHTLTFNIVNNLNAFYTDQNKLIETKKMYRRTLNEYEKAWDFDHSFIFRIVNNLRLFDVSRNEHVKSKELHSQKLDKNDEAHLMNQYSRSQSSITKTVLHKFKASMRTRKKDTTRQWTTPRDT